MDTGYLQVYTGDGKGKSTAAFGLVLRALGAGLRVHVIQFIKSMEYAEIRTFERLGVSVTQFGRGCFIYGEPEQEDKNMAALGLRFVGERFAAGDLDLVILDEINVACRIGLFSTQELMTLIAARPATMEVVCTGRDAPPELIAAADLVTEMRAIKHYYDTGVQARDGIER